MKKFITMILVIAVVATMAICFVGCKNDSTICVGITDYAPMNYKEEGSKEWTGFDTDLAKEVFTNLGYKNVVFVEIQWDQKYAELSAGNIQCIWNGFTADGTDMINGQEVSRKDSVDFTYNYMLNQQCVVAKADIANSIDGESGLKGKTGAAEKGSAGYEYATSVEGTVSIKECSSQRAALLEVISGTADFAVIDKLMANSMVGKGDFASLAQVSSIELEGEYYAVGFSKGSDLTAKVNAQLEALAANGKLQEIAKKYGLENSVITDYSDQK